MSNIFEDLEIEESISPTIFKDKRPLDHRWLPEKLVHRDEQIRQIAKYWVDVLSGVTPSNVTLLYMVKQGQVRLQHQSLHVSSLLI